MEKVTIFNPTTTRKKYNLKTNFSHEHPVDTKCPRPLPTGKQICSLAITSWASNAPIFQWFYCIHVITFWVTRWVLGVWLFGFWSSSLAHTWQRRHIFLNSLDFRDIFSKLAGFWLFLIIEMLDLWTQHWVITCMLLMKDDVFWWEKMQWLALCHIHTWQDISIYIGIIYIFTTNIYYMP
jgi:hypothetical protein